MAHTVKNLYEFIDRAVKSRKYPENTANGLKAALKLFDTSLNDEERDSLDIFQKNIDQIYRDVSTKNGNRFSAGSLAVYKSRILKIINDYEKYGVDPTKMAGWTPKMINRVPKKQTSNLKSSVAMPETNETPAMTTGMHKLEVALRPGIKSTIVVPMDITFAESAKIAAILNSLAI